MKRLLVLLFSFLFLQSAQAQWLNMAGGIDQDRVNFGFSLGLDHVGLIVAKQPDWNISGSNPFIDPGKPETLKAIRPLGKTGISLGLLANVRLTRAFDFRFTPKLSFVEWGIEYDYWDETNLGEFRTLSKTIDAAYVELPLLLKYKSMRQGNVRLYFIGGVKYMNDIRSKKKSRDDSDFKPSSDLKLIKMEEAYMAWEAGIGADVYLEYFKFSPEIRFSRSFNNVKQVGSDNKITYPLAGLFAESLHLTFYFE